MNHGPAPVLSAADNETISKVDRSAVRADFARTWSSLRTAGTHCSKTAAVRGELRAAEGSASQPCKSRCARGRTGNVAERSAEDDHRYASGGRGTRHACLRRRRCAENGRAHEPFVLVPASTPDRTGNSSLPDRLPTALLPRPTFGRRVKVHRPPYKRKVSSKGRRCVSDLSSETCHVLPRRNRRRRSVPRSVIFRTASASFRLRSEVNAPVAAGDVFSSIPRPAERPSA